MSTAPARPKQAGRLSGLAAWLGMLFGAEPGGAFVEVRQVGAARAPLREFHPIRELSAVAERIVRLGAERDTYVGVAPRCRREGGKSAIKRCHMLHVDADSEEAVDRLARFEPSPTLVVWSGSGGVHAYWKLRGPVPVELAEAGNRRLAHHLGADTGSVDASRILRPPQTFNHKHTPPVEVVLDGWRGGIYPLSEVVGALPDPPGPRAGAPRPPRRRDPAEEGGLMAMPSDFYVPALTGRPVDRGGFVRCPWHKDGNERTPSLRTWDDPSAGWFCFACNVGGSIIDFGARLYGLEARGSGYHEIKRRLTADLLPHLEAVAA